MSLAHSTACDTAPVAYGNRTYAGQADLLVVIDDRVPDREFLLSALAVSAAIVRISPRDAALEKIGEATERFPGRRVAIFCHGSPGTLLLGAHPITADASSRRSGRVALSRIRRSLRGAPVSLYACTVAEGRAGRALLATLAAALHCDVTASSRPVGSAAEGGAWDLDVTVSSDRQTLTAVGAGSSLFDPVKLSAYGHLLVVTNANDSGPGSLRAELAASSWAGEIPFDPATMGQTITLTSGPLTFNSTTSRVLTVRAEDHDLIISGNDLVLDLGTSGFRFRNQSGGDSSLTINSDVTGTGFIQHEGGGRDYVLTLGGNNSMSGSLGGGVQISLFVNGGGTVSISDDAALGSDSIVLATGKLRVTGATTIDNGIRLATSGTIETSAAVTVSGIVSDHSGAAGLTKTGSGTLTLSASNTYTGTTTVSAGTLAVTGALNGGGTVTVSSGGTLAGSGSISGAVTVASGGKLTPGNSPGQISTGNLTLSSGSTTSFELNGTTAGTQYDQINVTGTVDVSGANLSTNVGFTPSRGDSFALILNDGSDAVTGTFSGLAEGATFTAGGRIFQISYTAGDGNDIVLTDVSTSSGSGSDGSSAGSSATIGSNGNDRLLGSSSDDTMSGLAGNDTLWASDGNDTVYGGADADIVYGNPGGDRIHGEAGADTL